MNVEMNLDAINADIQAIETMFMKYQIDMESVYDCDISDIQFPRYVNLENLIDDLEHLGCIADEFANGFYKVLVAARNEVNRLNGSYKGFFKCEEELHKSLMDKWESQRC